MKWEEDLRAETWAGDVETDGAGEAAAKETEPTGKQALPGVRLAHGKVVAIVETAVA